MKYEIQLSDGQFTTVDEDTFIWAKHFLWNNSAGYVSRNGHYSGGVRTRALRLHRIIMNCPDNMEVDHINGNPLDNRRSNLRVCTKPENIQNYSKPRHNTSGYLGVSLHKRSQKWQANIRIEGKQTYLGEFESKEDAARAYNEAALKYRGQFAHLNEGV